jgi:TonB family protein
MTSALFLVLAAAALGTTGSAPPLDNGGARPSANAEFLAKNYPPESLQRGEQGRVGFQLTFAADGSLTGCAITQSSGFATLDNGTCDMLARSAKIEPARDSDGRRVSAVRTGYIDWKLPSNSVKIAQAGAPGRKSSADPLVCKRSSVPGSIIKRIKRCMTKSEWAAQERLVQDEIQRALRANTCSDHGC